MTAAKKYCERKRNKELQFAFSNVVFPNICNMKNIIFIFILRWKLKNRSFWFLLVCILYIFNNNNKSEAIFCVCLVLFHQGCFMIFDDDNVFTILLCLAECRGSFSPHFLCQYNLSNHCTVVEPWAVPERRPTSGVEQWLPRRPLGNPWVAADPWNGSVAAGRTSGPPVTSGRSLGNPLGPSYLWSGVVVAWRTSGSPAISGRPMGKSWATADLWSWAVATGVEPWRQEPDRSEVAAGGEP